MQYCVCSVYSVLSGTSSRRPHAVPPAFSTTEIVEHSLVLVPGRYVSFRWRGDATRAGIRHTLRQGRQPLQVPGTLMIENVEYLSYIKIRSLAFLVRDHASCHILPDRSVEIHHCHKNVAIRCLNLSLPHFCGDDCHNDCHKTRLITGPFATFYERAFTSLFKP